MEILFSSPDRPIKPKPFTQICPLDHPFFSFLFPKKISRSPSTRRASTSSASCRAPTSGTRGTGRSCWYDDGAAPIPPDIVLKSSFHHEIPHNLPHIFSIPQAAHWDVVANTTGLNDNGSGVAAMLEVARVLGAADCLAGEQKHTVIFVAIDKEVSKIVGGSSKCICAKLRPLPSAFPPLHAP